MRRREFTALLGVAAMWPATARAQQPERIRLVGALWALSADSPFVRLNVEAFVQRLRQLGWFEGRNLRIEHRYGGGDTDRIRRYAAELVALAPDVILANNGPATLAALLEATRTVPIVFATVPDPVASGFVESLARPGGNATGFDIFENSFSGKLLEILKEVAPRVSRVAFLREAGIAASVGPLAAMQTAAPSLSVEVKPINVADASGLERAVASFAGVPNGGLVVSGSPGVAAHADLIIGLAARHRLPAVYYERRYVIGGGLIGYGPRLIDFYPRAAEYVDRILRGAKPADLPVQAPTKYELVINLKTAKALGLEVPATLLSRADEVIE
jgi:putative tryptophan/tyrosine transport system substrate-binding protein